MMNSLILERALISDMYKYNTLPWLDPENATIFLRPLNIVQNQKKKIQSLTKSPFPLKSKWQCAAVSRYRLLTTEAVQTNCSWSAPSCRRCNAASHGHLRMSGTIWPLEIRVVGKSPVRWPQSMAFAGMEGGAPLMALKRRKIVMRIIVISIMVNCGQRPEFEDKNIVNLEGFEKKKMLLLQTVKPMNA